MDKNLNVENSVDGPGWDWDKIEYLLYKIGMSEQEIKESLSDGNKLLENLAKRWDSI